MTDTVIHHTTFVIERVYDASVARVYAAFSEPGPRERWFVKGDGFAISEYDYDFRAGGIERGRFKPDGMDTYFINETRIFDVVENERVIFSYSMAAEGQPPFSVSLVTAEFIVEGASTRLKFTEQGAYLKSAGVDHAAMREQGQNQLLDALGREIAGSLQGA